MTFQPSSSEETILHCYVLSSDLRERHVGAAQEPGQHPAPELVLPTMSLTLTTTPAGLGAPVWQMGKLRPGVAGTQLAQGHTASK